MGKNSLLDFPNQWRFLYPCLLKGNFSRALLSSTQILVICAQIFNRMQRFLLRIECMSRVNFKPVSGYVFSVIQSEVRWVLEPPGCKGLGPLF